VPSGSLVAPWPLVGRADEVALASDALHERGAVVLAGVAGVGKTRLAREVLASEEAAGVPTSWVGATRSAATVALGAFAHLVPPSAGELREGQDGRAATLDAVVRALEVQSRAGHSVLGVDDAHLLDDASAALVHLLVSGGTARVVATVRSGEATPDPVVALWKDEMALRIEVQPLSRPEIAGLLGGALGGTVDGATARRLFEVTRGNVLFLRELVASGLASGSLAERAGVWCWEGRLRPGVRLRDLVEGRIGALDAAERDALELLALGEPVPEDVIGHLVDSDVLRRLERRRLVETRTTAERIEVALGHPMFGEVLVDDASPRRLNECRRQLAAAWGQKSGLGRDDLLRVALWHADAGVQAEPHVLLGGAHRAMVLGDNPTAERLARQAHDAAPSIETGYLLGDALHSLGRSEDAIATWRSAQDLPGTQAEHARLATSIADVLTAGLDRPGEAREVLTEAALRLRDPEAVDQVVSMEALLRSLGSATTSEALEVATALLARPDLSLTGQLRGQLAAAAGWVDAGRTDQAIATCQEAMGVALREEITGLALYHAMTLTQALLLAGRLPDADALVTAGHEAALSFHADVARGAWGFLGGVISVFRGRPTRAAAALRESDLTLGRFDYGLRRGVFIWLAMAHALVGDPHAAEANLDQAQRTNRSRARLYDADWARARAWTLMAAGRHSAADEALAEAAEVAVRAERWAYEVLALHDRARLLGQAGAARVAPRLDELATQVDGRLAVACAAHARGVADADGAALDRVADTFVELGFELFAAEAQAAAAVAHDHAGERAAASASAERARRMAAACEGATTPALRSLATLAGPVALTRREREMAELAARGLTDREIAAELFVSIRTVHAHLRSVYAKLGVSGRSELGRALGI
jgi:DNA-binding CsgD family transcriptional regulator